MNMVHMVVFLEDVVSYSKNSKLNKYLLRLLVFVFLLN